MQRILLLLFVSVNLLWAQKIAVLDLEPVGNFDKNEITILSERFRSEIVKTGKFEVMERNELAALNRELALQHSEGFDTLAVAKAGRKLGAKYIVLGYLGRLGEIYTVDVKIVDCETSRIEQSYNMDYRGNIEGLVEVMRRIAHQIAGIQERHSPWFWIGSGTVVLTAVAVYFFYLAPSGQEGLPLPPQPPTTP